MTRISLAFVLCLSLALILWVTVTPAVAQQLKLDIKDGRVNLEANEVPLRQILAEWQRVGGARIAGGDKVRGAPVTLRLADIPEGQALDIVLRDIAGYIAIRRPIPAVGGPSIYDRLLIMPASKAPATSASANRLMPNTSVAAGEPGLRKGKCRLLSRLPRRRGQATLKKPRAFPNMLRCPFRVLLMGRPRRDCWAAAGIPAQDLPWRACCTRISRQSPP